MDGTGASELAGITDCCIVIRSAIYDKSKTSRHIIRNASSAAVCKRRKEHGTRPRSPVQACHQLGAALSYEDFEFCRQTLISTISRCNNLQFFYLSALFSSLLHCFRPLHQSEISRIFYLLFANDGSKKDDSGDSRSIFEQLQAICENVVRVDSRGFVHLALPTVKRFIQHYPIKGIDRSHFTLARACIAEIAAEQELSPAQTVLRGEQTSFSAYAAQQWHRHYRYVQLTSPGLTGQAHEILQTQITRRIGVIDDQTHQNASQEHAKRFCEAAGLSVLLEKYTQLSSQSHDAPFPSYPLRSKADSREDVVAVSERLACLRTDDSDEENENDWVLVA